MSPSCDCGPNKPFWTLKVLFFGAIHGASTSLLMFFHRLWSLRCGLSTSTVATPQEHSSNQTATHCSILLNGICPNDELKHQQWWFWHAHVLCCNTYLFWSGLSNLEKVERLWKVFFGHQMTYQKSGKDFKIQAVASDLMSQVQFSSSFLGCSIFTIDS